MSARWFGLIVFVWMIMTVLGYASDGTIRDSGAIDDVLHLRVISIDATGVGPFKVPLPHVNFDYFQGAWKLASWDFSMFSSHGMAYVRWAVWLPISAIFFYGLVTGLGPIFISAAQVVISATAALTRSLGGLVGIR